MKKLRGYLLINTFFKSKKLDDLYSLLLSSFKEKDINLEIKTADEISLSVDHYFLDNEKPDFVLFYDKDIYLAERLEYNGIPVFNSKRAIELTDNKILMYQELQRKGIRIPKAYIAPKTFEGLNREGFDWLKNIENDLTYPMIVKEAYGSFGEQVYLIKSHLEMLDLIVRLNFKDFLIQEYIESSSGKDIRVNVVNGKEVVSILRENEDDFRSNISGGGHASKVEINDEFRKLAIEATKALGLKFAGVDLMFLSDGSPIVCEVNSNPQFRSTLDATGVNLAYFIADMIKEELTFKRGLLIYDAEDTDRNKWLIDELLFRAKDYGLSLKLIDPVLNLEQINFVNNYDFIINRSRDPYLANTIKRFAKRKICINNPDVNLLANDKFLSHELFTNLGLATVQTEIFDNHISKFPKVMKSRTGHGGKEVFLVNSQDEILNISRSLSDRKWIYQEYIEGANKDLRVYIYDDKIFAGVLRENKDDFRSNYSLGGKVTLVKDILFGIQEACQKIIDEIHPDFIGIDFLLPNGLNGEFYVNEIEDPVGSRMLCSLMDIDLPDMFLSLIKNKFNL